MDKTSNDERRQYTMTTANLNLITVDKMLFTTVGLRMFEDGTVQLYDYADKKWIDIDVKVRKVEI